MEKKKEDENNSSSKKKYNIGILGKKHSLNKTVELLKNLRPSYAKGETTFEQYKN